MEGVIAEDHSGRTPIEILEESEFLVDDDHRVVCESLKRCYQTLIKLQKHWQTQLDTLRKQHEMTFLAMKHQHDEDLRKETDRQEEMAIELNKLYESVEILSKENLEMDEKIQRLGTADRSSSEKLEKLTKEVQKLKKEKAEEEENVEALHQLIEDKDEEIKTLSARVRKLTKDMQHVMAWYDDRESGLSDTQKHLQKMVDSYVEIHGKLSRERETLRSVMAKRGIDTTMKSTLGGPPPPPPPPPPRTPPRAAAQNWDEDGVPMGEAADAAAAAATVALTSQRTIPSPD